MLDKIRASLNVTFQYYFPCPALPGGVGGASAAVKNMTANNPNMSAADWSAYQTNFSGEFLLKNPQGCQVVSSARRQASAFVTPGQQDALNMLDKAKEPNFCPDLMCFAAGAIKLTSSM